MRGIKKYVLHKDKATKATNSDALVAILQADGWVVQGEKQETVQSVSVEDDIEALREKAKSLDIKVHHLAKSETIKRLIEQKINPTQ